MSSLLRTEDQHDDWRPTSGPHTQRLDKRQIAEGNSEPVLGWENRTRYTTIPEMALGLIYTAEGGADLFTPSTLRQMCLLEAHIHTHPSYRDVCSLSVDAQQCREAEGSIVRVFYDRGGQEHNWSCPLLSEEHVRTINGGLHLPSTYAKHPEALFFVKKGEGPVEGNVTRGNGGDMTATRSVVFVAGLPLDGYRNAQDRQIEQISKVIPFLTSVRDGMLHHLEAAHPHGPFGQSPFRLNQGRGWGMPLDDGTPRPKKTESEPGLTVALWNKLLFFEEEYDMFFADTLWAGLAFGFIFLFFLLYTHSFLYAFMGCAQIFFAFNTALVLYRFVLQLDYFGTLQKGALFLLCGIGADNVLVLWDTWIHRRTRHPKDISYERAITDLYGACYHTAFATASTNLTTAAAFFALASSPLMPFRAVGIFIGLCTFTNWVWALALMSPMLVLCDRWKREGCCGETSECRRRSPADYGPSPLPVSSKSEQEQPAIPMAKAVTSSTAEPLDEHTLRTSASSSQAFGSVEPSVPLGTSEPAEGPPDVPESDDGQPPKRGLGLRCLEAIYIRPLSWKVKGVKVVCWASLLAFTAFCAINIWFASQLHITPQTWPEMTFSQGHMMADVAHRLTQTFQGQSLPGAFVRVSFLFGVKSLERPPPFSEWNPAVYRGEVRYDANFTLESSAAQAFILDLCEEIRQKECDLPICEHSPLGDRKLALPGTVECFLEDFSRWIPSNSSTSSGSMTSRLRIFQSEDLDANGVPRHASIIGFERGQLRWVQVKFTTSVHALNRVSDVLTFGNWLDEWERDLRSRAPSELMTLSYDGSLELANAEVLTGVITSLFEGLSIVFPVVFVVLLVMSRNLILATFSFCTIGAIVASILGFISVIIGWGLGFYECITTIGTIGFSIDYVIHLSYVYQHCPKSLCDNREERTKYAIREMALTVLAAAVTTASAGIAMAFCQSPGYRRFGYLLMLAVGLSLVYSLGFFLPLCMLFGPRNGMGSIGALCTRGRRRVDATSTRPKDSSDGRERRETEAENREVIGP
mmetsp:Transcript_908/g.2011  ORF Transcript_908/g.2011 Transcript_908/m.2011 type:complete len:1034 (-) Transcript_908:60-3161(-)